MQRRTTVGIVVFYHQVLRLLGIHEGGRKGVLLGLYVLVVLEAVLRQQLFYLLVGTRCNLVNHRPGESHQCLVAHIVGKALRHQSVARPALGIRQNTGLHTIAIVRAVVHRLHGNRQLAGLVALIQQCCHLTEGKDGLQTALQVLLVIAIALLGDGERNHLQRGLPEYLAQPLPVGKLVVGLQRLGNAGNDFLLHRAVALQRHQQRQVVVRLICLVDDFIVEGLCHDDATVVLSAVQRVVQHCGREGAEDVTAAEVYPRRFLRGLLAYLIYIILGELVAGPPHPLPKGGVFD